MRGDREIEVSVCDIVGYLTSSTKIREEMQSSYCLRHYYFLFVLFLGIINSYQGLLNRLTLRVTCITTTVTKCLMLHDTVNI